MEGTTMSVGTMSLVFEYDMPELKTDDGKTVPDSTAKFVLLALADHANDEGEGAYPGVKRICKKTSMSSQTVCNALNALRHNGYTNLEGKSKLETNNYTINIKKLSQPVGFQPVESPDSNDKNPKIPATRVKPSINHQLNHQVEEERNPLFSFYESKIGLLTPIMADAIEAAEKVYSPKWVADAIELASEKGARHWNYCEAVLKRWKQEGRVEKPARKQRAADAGDPGKYTSGQYSEYLA
jgi:DnaD/phage-associated family protein